MPFSPAGDPSGGTGKLGNTNVATGFVVNTTQGFNT